jgi:glycosyltransferase involved in cell wall biosynthesis
MSESAFELVSSRPAAATKSLSVPHDPVLLLPANDTPQPVLSIVIPSLNEEITIGTFVDWCMEGIRDCGVPAEVLIVDSSTDRTAEIALSHGARVLKTPKRGLGRAYIDAIPFIRGKYVLLGDADCTYDFRRLKPFVEQFENGYEFIMGSRFLGSIQTGAMPPLHRYFGTPLTTFILNVMQGSSFSDIHCGMRGVSLDALKRMDLRSQSWEYASEMILKSLHLRLRSTEVPVNFLKDPEGRHSHLVRMGWLSPWYAGWINLRAMFIHGADFFVLRPGLVLLALGLCLILPLTLGPITVGPLTLSLNAMLVGLTLATLGLQMFFIGCIAQCLYDMTGAALQRWTELFPYTPVSLFSGVLFGIGLAASTQFAFQFTAAGFVMGPHLTLSNHLAIAGVWAILTAVISFISMLLIHAVGVQAHHLRQQRTHEPGRS